MSAHHVEVASDFSSVTGTGDVHVAVTDETNETMSPFSVKHHGDNSDSGKSFTLPESCPEVIYIQGPPGPQGCDGEPGPMGHTGRQGPPGSQGPVGPAGPRGGTGPCGPQGPPGHIGKIGPKGSKGDDGPQGETGPEGPEGPPGPRGPQGKNGAQGPPGRGGPQGPMGPPGERGSVGPEGPCGPPGPPGSGGPRGPPGPQGGVGPAGPEGKMGPEGPPGQDGAPGRDGARGPEGPPGVCVCKGVRTDVIVVVVHDYQVAHGDTHLVIRSAMPRQITLPVLPKANIETGMGFETHPIHIRSLATSGSHKITVGSKDNSINESHKYFSLESQKTVTLVPIGGVWYSF